MHFCPPMHYYSRMDMGCSQRPVRCAGFRSADPRIPGSSSGLWESKVLGSRCLWGGDLATSLRRPGEQETPGAKSFLVCCRIVLSRSPRFWEIYKLRRDHQWFSPNILKKQASINQGETNIYVIRCLIIFFLDENNGVMDVFTLVQ